MTTKTTTTTKETYRTLCLVFFVYFLLRCWDSFFYRENNYPHVRTSIQSDDRRSRSSDFNNGVFGKKRRCRIQEEDEMNRIKKKEKNEWKFTGRNCSVCIYQVCSCSLYGACLSLSAAAAVRGSSVRCTRRPALQAKQRTRFFSLASSPFRIEDTDLFFLFFLFVWFSSRRSRFLTGVSTMCGRGGGYESGHGGRTWRDVILVPYLSIL